MVFKNDKQRKAVMSKLRSKSPVPARVRTWKKELSAVGDNPEFIEHSISDIELQLIRDRPDTHLLRESARHISQWADEIDLAQRRARIKHIGV